MTAVSTPALLARPTDQNGVIERVALIRSLAGPDGFVTVRISLDLDDIIAGDFEVFLDNLSLISTGTISLTDLTYKPVGTTGDDQIILEVTGSVEHLDDAL